MIRISTLLTRATAAIMLGSLMLLAGCHNGATKDPARLASMRSHADLTIEAYKDGQFLVDGAVLSAIDTGGHFSYLKDQGRLPKTVLLLPSDDSGIKKQHLQYMARMVLDFGFRGYYDDNGVFTEISPVDIKARRLDDHHERAPTPNIPVRDHTQGNGSMGTAGGP